MIHCSLRRKSGLVAFDIKPKQCFADANVWFDEAENGLEIPTVDLLRRKYEMDACYALASKLNSRKGEKAVLLMKIESVTYRYTGYLAAFRWAQFFHLGG